MGGHGATIHEERAGVEAVGARRQPIAQAFVLETRFISG
jgi:hypothetical protein